MCVEVHGVILLCGSTKPSWALNEWHLQRSEWWVLKLSAKCVLRLVDNHRAQPKEWLSWCICVPIYSKGVCACLCEHTGCTQISLLRVKSVKYRNTLLQLLIRCTQIWRACQVTPIHWQTPLFKSLLKTHTQIHMHTPSIKRESQKLGAEGGWQRRAPRGANTDSSETTHPLSYLPKTNLSIHTNKHMLYKQMHIYHLSECKGCRTNIHCS